MTTKPMTRDEILKAMDSLSYHYVYDHTPTDELANEIIEASCGLAECFINYLDAVGYQVVKKVADGKMIDAGFDAINGEISEAGCDNVFNAMCEQGRLR